MKRSVPIRQNVKTKILASKVELTQLKIESIKEFKIIVIVQ
jgi:hypothetical protein